MEKNLKLFVKRTIIYFAMIFLIWTLKNIIGSSLQINGLIGPYGNFPFFRKALFEAFGIIFVFFIIYHRKELSKLKIDKLHFKDAFFFILAAVLSLTIYYLNNYLLRINNVQIPFVLNVFPIFNLIFLVGFAAFLALAIFGRSTFIQLLTINKKSNLKYVFSYIALSLILVGLQKVWPLFSKIVTFFLIKLLNPYYSVYTLLQDAGPFLKVNNFAVIIGEPCSGVDSMILFCAFFAAMYAVDHKRIIKPKFALLFGLGLLGVFFINILRLYFLILIGVNYSPELAVGLFHANAGWVFFVIYYLSYYWIIKKYIYVQKLV